MLRNSPVPSAKTWRMFPGLPDSRCCQPEIIHGVLTGQLDQIGVEKCKQPFPILWDEQKKFFGIE